ncbi:unnamed protein product [Ostreobium quekettii]|uniref:C2H2-type domain-containing protein n=1 Tax=Ostreobium quekettii TaxID=121088 RepID=A0A8S1IUM7_9CHLO|nr:unnamed protein product [Ostreobium quekettii]|eukprot:evm.model.scf_425EXC.2 EVM.evm.TU.scf_425EXC.2   scf_425EXC:10662-13304(-)
MHTALALWTRALALTLLGVVLLPVAGAAEEEKGAFAAPAFCDREASRHAREIIRQFLLPELHAREYHFPSRCRLEESRDMYAWQESQKTLGVRGTWKCNFCGKVFRNEHYVDGHLDRRHADQVRPSADVCLADLCPLLLCDDLANDAIPGDAHAVSPCSAFDQQRRQRQCGLLASECFPLDGGAVSVDLHEYFTQYFCEALTCDGSLKAQRLRALRGARVEQTGLAYPVLSVFTLAALAMFYVVYCGTREARPEGPLARGDLRRREPRERPVRRGVASWAGFLWKEEKAKEY